jgi:rubredoxin-NAD+ reductase
MNPIVIIGTGLAGYTLAREFRKLDADTPLVLISADDGAFYSKPMLSNAFAQGKDAGALVNTPAGKMADQLDARILTQTRVTGIDTRARQVVTGQETIGYARLVLALGADPIRLPLDGDAAGSVLSVNDLADYARFREALTRGPRVALLGAGLIGCEFANDLAAQGYSVDVIDLAPLPLGRLLPEACGAAMRDALTAAGIRLHLGTQVERIAHEANGIALTLANGETIDADTVLSAVGLRPRTALAEAAGLAVGRGIQVDRRLQTSAEDVYALGDCAEVDGVVLPYVMPIMHAARALAKTLANEPTPVIYPAMPVVVKTPALATVVNPPAPGSEGEWRISGQAPELRADFVGPDGRLLGVCLMGEATKQKQVVTRELPSPLG